MVEYLLVLILAVENGEVWVPSYTKTYETMEECMGDALSIQLDENDPFNAVCMPYVEGNGI
jgi:hypothetical protein